MKAAEDLAAVIRSWLFIKAWERALAGRREVDPRLTALRQQLREERVRRAREPHPRKLDRR